MQTIKFFSLLALVSFAESALADEGPGELLEPAVTTPTSWQCVVRDGFGGKHYGHGSTRERALHLAWLVCSNDMGPFVVCGPGGHCRERKGN